MVDYEKLKEYRRLDLQIIRFERQHDFFNAVLGDPNTSITVLKQLIPLLQRYLELSESFTDEEKEVVKDYGYHHVDPTFTSEDWE